MLLYYIICSEKHDMILLFRNSSGRFRTISKYIFEIVLDGSERFRTISKYILEIVLDGSERFRTISKTGTIQNYPELSRNIQNYLELNGFFAME